MEKNKFEHDPPRTSSLPSTHVQIQECGERAVHTCINWKSVCTKSQSSRIVYSTSKIRLMIISRQLKDQFV